MHQTLQAFCAPHLRPGMHIVLHAVPCMPINTCVLQEVLGQGCFVAAFGGAVGHMAEEYCSRRGTKGTNL